MQVNLATAAYPLEFLSSQAAYEDKIATWVADAARHKAHILMFPEYAGMELAGLDGAQSAGDPSEGRFAAADRVELLMKTHRALAQEYGVYILSGSLPVRDGEGFVNRAHLFAPSGTVAWQDKQIMTPFERDPWDIRPNPGLKIFETPLGRIGILICYDCEFPLLARSLSEVDILLAPSCTETVAGYWRVRIGAMARALEGQTISAMASLVGKCPEIYAIEENHGAGGIFCPPDAKMGLPETGILALGSMDMSAWTIAECDIGCMRRLRTEGATLNYQHWNEQIGVAERVESIKLT